MIEQSEWWTRLSNKGNCFILKFISPLEIDPQLVWSFTGATRGDDDNEVVRLLDEGVPVDSVDLDSLTAIKRAAMHNQTDFIQELLQTGANVNKRDRRDFTAPHWSAKFNSTDVIRLLLQHGASTTIKDKYGRTPIDCAREENHKEVVLLLQH